MLLLSLLVAPAAFAADVDLDPIRRLAIMHGGRVKPLDTYAL